MRFIDCVTNKNKGISTVLIEHRGRYYEGKATLSDEDTWSNFFGCRIAEIKATQKALRRERQDKKRELRECQKFVNSLKGYKDFSFDNPLAKKIIRQLKLREREYRDLVLAEERLKDYYYSQISEMDKRQKQEKNRSKNINNVEE